MSFLSKLGDIVGGSLFKEAKDVVMAYWPPEIGPEKRAEMEMKLLEAERAKQAQINEALAESERMITERVALVEGSAQDLRAIPLIGPIIIFLRGLQRPIWGYLTMYLDCLWFMGQVQLNQQQESALWVINFLVLGFLFGERAVQNLTPFITEMLKAKQTK